MTTQESIAASIKLASYATSAWRPYRHHRAETQEERARHNTQAVSVRVKLTDSPDLAAIIAHQEATGRLHRTLTLPSPLSELRVLCSGRELEHAEMLRAAREKHTHLVDSFAAEYPAIKADAPRRLNGLYEADAWPDSVSGRFALESRYYPCPTEGVWVTWIDDMVSMARTELKNRLTEALSQYRDRLTGAERLHSSVVDTLTRALADVSKAGEIASPSLRATAAGALAALGNTDIEALRQNDALRADAASKAGDILSTLAGATL